MRYAYEMRNVVGPSHFAGEKPRPGGMALVLGTLVALTGPLTAISGQWSLWSSVVTSDRQWLGVWGGGAIHSSIYTCSLDPAANFQGPSSLPTGF